MLLLWHSANIIAVALSELQVLCVEFVQLIGGCSLEQRKCALIKPKLVQNCVLQVRQISDVNGRLFDIQAYCMYSGHIRIAQE